MSACQCVPTRGTRAFVDDAWVTTSGSASPSWTLSILFFAEHEVASLRLPSSWFGRPHDKWHQLTEAATVGDEVQVRLDDKQVLRLDEDASGEERVLRVFIRGGRWHWTEYGGDTDHSEVLAVGAVEFYVPFHR
jgi:hypothetical protein